MRRGSSGALPSGYGALPSAGWRRWRLPLAGVAGALLIATLVDQTAYTLLTFPQVYDGKWGRLFRMVGWLPLWFVVGFAFYRIAGTSIAKRHALLLMAAPTLAGACSELIKLLIRRGRPTAAEGSYVFRAFLDQPLYTAHFGMPSGDATVAFAVALILTRVWPKAWVIWYGLAVGCALGRVLSRAHFLSDVTAAAVLGTAVAEWLWRRFGKRDLLPSTAT